MKLRRIAALLLLAATMLIGCSCSDNGGGEPAPSAEAASTATAEYTPQAENTAEASGQPGAPSETAPAATRDENRIYSPDDYCIDYRSFTVGEGGHSTLAECEDSIFMLCKGFLYFTDKEYKDWMPLCPRPDCKHDSEDCNAFLGAAALQYRNGYIYYVDNCVWDIDDELYHVHHPCLCRMRTDGTQHERLFEIPYPEFDDKDFNTMNDSWACFATNKYFVFKLTLFEYDEYGDPSFEKHMFSLDIDTYNITQLFTDMPDRAKAASAFLILEGRDNLIYGQENYAASGGKNVIVEVDLESGKTRELCRFEPYIRYLEKVSSISDKALYFIDFDFDTDEETLYRLDLETCELTTEYVDSASQSKWTQFDAYSGYYYRAGGTFLPEEERGTYICDMNFNVIEFLPYDEYPQEYFEEYEDFIAECRKLHPDLEFAGEMHYLISISFVTRDYIFGTATELELVSYEKLNDDQQVETHYAIRAWGAPSSIPMWYLDKKDIGTGNLQWKKWAP